MVGGGEGYFFFGEGGGDWGVRVLSSFLAAKNRKGGEGIEKVNSSSSLFIKV